MKKLLFAFLLLVSCSQGDGVTAAPVAEVTQKKISHSAKPTEQEACTGNWRDFSNGCRDYCSKDKFQMCTMVFGPGCDCGPDQCFDKKQMKCVDNPE